MQSLQQIVIDNIVIRGNLLRTLFKRNMDQFFLAKDLVKGDVNKAGGLANAGPGHKDTQVSRT
jgi:hypothetical protein